MGELKKKDEVRCRGLIGSLLWLWTRRQVRLSAMWVGKRGAYVVWCREGSVKGIVRREEGEGDVCEERQRRDTEKSRRSKRRNLDPS